MSTDTADLDAYFRRIGYGGSGAPSLATLREIHLRHVLAIPFENLDTLLGRPVRLDLPSLEEKLLRRGRGGYCFEHNLLLSHVLRTLGFEVTGLAARVRWGTQPGALRPRTHMLLQIELPGDGGEAPWLADVGFGGLTLTGPLRFAPEIEQPTPHEPFRLVREGDGYVLEALLREVWTALYVFDLRREWLADFEVANWYVANHPQSHFVTSLLCARPTAQQRFGLRDDRLSIHTLRGKTEIRQMTTVAQLRCVLETTFGITLPGGPELDAKLGGLIAREAAGR